MSREGLVKVLYVRTELYLLYVVCERKHDVQLYVQSL